MKTLLTLFAAPFLFLGSLFANHPAPTMPIPASTATTTFYSGSDAQPSDEYDIYHLQGTLADARQNLGATNAIETPIAVFHTSLANQITANATSMTLESALTADGTTLASSTYSFVIDSGQPTQEFVEADCTGTACTNMQRGMSVVTGTTTVVSSEQSHRRTASVDIVDAPLLIKLTNIINGVSTFPNVIGYTTDLSSAAWSTQPNTAIPSLGILRSTSIAGASNATESVNGISQLATGAQAGASTSFGSSGARLVLPSSLATSSCKVLQSSILAASSTTGKLDPLCFDQTQNYTFVGTTTFATTSAASSTITTLNSTTVNAQTINDNGLSLASKLYGNGSNGALAITSGTTTINVGGAAVYSLDYSSISITGTGGLTISNANTNGTTLILRSQGACTLTSTAIPFLDLTSFGGAAGAVGTAGSGVNSGVNGGGVLGGYGGVVNQANTTSGQGGGGGGSGGGEGSPGTLYNVSGSAAATGFAGQGGSMWQISSTTIQALPGGGGGGAGAYAAAGSGTSGGGGAGGGGLIILCGGNLNLTGTIWSKGKNGVSATGGTTGSAGGGAGAGGNVLIMYNALTANSGTITLTGGSGGSGGGTVSNGGGNGATGSSLVIPNLTFY